MQDCSVARMMEGIVSKSYTSYNRFYGHKIQNLWLDYTRPFPKRMLTCGRKYVLLSLSKCMLRQLRGFRLKKNFGEFFVKSNEFLVHRTNVLVNVYDLSCDCF